MEKIGRIRDCRTQKSDNIDFCRPTADTYTVIHAHELTWEVSAVRLRLVRGVLASR